MLSLPSVQATLEGTIPPEISLPCCHHPEPWAPSSCSAGAPCPTTQLRKATSMSLKRQKSEYFISLSSSDTTVAAFHKRIPALLNIHLRKHIKFQGRQKKKIKNCGQSYLSSPLNNMCVCCRQSSSTCFTYQVKIKLQTAAKLPNANLEEMREGLR